MIYDKESMKRFGRAARLRTLQAIHDALLESGEHVYLSVKTLDRVAEISDELLKKIEDTLE